MQHRERVIARIVVATSIVLVTMAACAAASVVTLSGRAERVRGEVTLLAVYALAVIAPGIFALRAPTRRRMLVWTIATWLGAIAYYEGVRPWQVDRAFDLALAACTCFTFVGSAVALLAMIPPTPPSDTVSAERARVMRRLGMAFVTLSTLVAALALMPGLLVHNYDGRVWAEDCGGPFAIGALAFAAFPAALYWRDAEIAWRKWILWLLCLVPGLAAAHVAVNLHVELLATNERLWPLDLAGLGVAALAALAMVVIPLALLSTSGPKLPRARVVE